MESSINTEDFARLLHMTAHNWRTALLGAELVTGRASLYVRLLTPVAKVVQRARGNGRIGPTGPTGPAGDAAAAIR